jgi:hypothetical protein
MLEKKELKAMERQSRGNISIHQLFGAKELGVREAETRTEDIIRLFLSVGEAVAARWIQMPKAILLLQMVPNDSASGAIYLYDRARKYFYLLSFEGADDSFTLEQFEQIIREYNLLHYLERPELCALMSGADSAQTN